MKYKLFFSLILMVHSPIVFAYMNQAHKKFADISLNAIELKSISNNSGKDALSDFYAERLGFTLDNTRYTFDNVNEGGAGDIIVEKIMYDTKEWLEIILEGASDEDYPLYRTLNHFYDPINNHSLFQTIQHRGYTAISDLVGQLSSSMTTPDWALEDNGNNLTQNYSLKDSQDYLYKALTSTSSDVRTKSLGEHLYALAHVLHLLADMGQPEHVRNDAHPPLPGRNSLYEEYTDNLIDKQEINFAAIYDNNKYAVEKSQFKTARDFWKNGGKGLAEYTNANFVSPDTNFDTNYYTLPSQGTVDKVSVDVLYQEIGKPVPNDFGGQQLTGEVEFIATTVQDQQTSPTHAFSNTRASSYSLFNREVTSKVNQCTEVIDDNIYSSTASVEMIERYCKRYTLNRWNFDKFHEFIAPRIIGYGAAFISHLYRGNIDFFPPTSAQAADLKAAPLVNGIAQLPLMLKNTTPDEAMEPGKLVAVVTYVNSNNEVVEVIASDEITGAPPRTTSQPFRFKFTKRAFPLTMEGLTAYIQVIFRGKLGDDEDTIVVARKPLSEIIQPFTLNADVPESGVYAAIDHSNFETNFTSLTMNLGSSAQLDGTLVPSAFYHIDACLSYYNNCNGSYARSTESYTSASSAFPADTLNLPMTMVFANGIPPNASDLFINFINFKTDPTRPVGIAFVDISEPTFISVINNTDYYAYDGTYKTIEELRTDPLAVPLLDEMKIEKEILTIHLAFPYGGFSYPDGGYLESENLEPGHFSRMAVLTQPGTFDLYYKASGFSRDISGSYQTLNSAVLQAHPEIGIIEYGPTPYSKRGIISHHVLHFEYPAYLKEGDIQQVPAIGLDLAKPVYNYLQ